MSPHSRDMEITSPKNLSLALDMMANNQDDEALRLLQDQSDEDREISCAFLDYLVEEFSVEPA